MNTPRDPAITDYLADCRLRGHRQDTLKLRRQVLTQCAASLRQPLLLVSEDDLYRWYTAYAGHSVATRVAYGRAIRAFYKWAQARHLIDNDPSRALPIPRSPQPSPRPMTPAELTTALASATPRIRLWLILAAGAGLRAVEIARLRRDDLEHVNGTPVLRVREGKGGKPRSLVVSPAVAAAIETWQTGPGRLTPVTPAYVSNLVARHLHDLGIAATLHKARALYATIYYQASGHDVEQTMAVLGHSEYASMRHYIQSSPRTAVQAVEAIDRLFTHTIVAA